MEHPANPNFTSKYVITAIFIIALFFGLIRFINLNADFPPGITTSGALYTDEGWYSASAVRYYLTGEWYYPGDINYAVHQPGSQILYLLSFYILGLSLSSERIVVAILFILFTVLLASLLRKNFGNFAAMISAVLLSTNFLAFAYSRLAFRFLIALFFIVAALYIAGNLSSQRGILMVIISSLLLAYGILTCTTAVFAVPLFLFLVWKNGKSLKEKLIDVIVGGVLVSILAGSYLLIMRSQYPSDFAVYDGAVSSSFITGLSQWPLNLLHKVYWSFRYISPDFVGLTALLTLFALVVSKQFRTNPIVQMLLGYLVIYIAMLSITTYEPPRYFLMLLVPFTGLCAVACITVMKWLSEKKLASIAFLPLLLVGLVSFHGSWQIISYMSHPKYSFYQMAHGVENIIQGREGRVKGVLLFGDIADSVSIEIGTNAANSLMWTSRTVGDRLALYHPKYLIVHGSNVAQVAVAEGGAITELGSWDVFNNYYANGEQVRLYYVTWPGDVHQ